MTHITSFDFGARNCSLSANDGKHPFKAFRATSHLKHGVHLSRNYSLPVISNRWLEMHAIPTLSVI
jgi:hypothetical protein